MSDEISRKFDALIDTPVGRKIMLARLRSLAQDNARLKRKVAESRIAVHALNEFSVHLVDILQGACDLLNASGIPMDRKSKNRFKRMKAFQIENYTDEMVDRIEGILNDNEGEEILMSDLVGEEGR